MLRSARFFAFVLVASAVGLTSCGGGDDGNAAPAEPGTVILRPSAFQPETITIAAGETVTWKWREKVSHNIVGKGGIDKKVADNGTYTHTFDKKGTYDYRCTVHPGMDGSIVVE